ncbi:hypothetical protein RND81_07G119600 [Saponaria officinalis]|uniref:Malonyl-CoA decarboxylase n=1 Tax=Saponaria officinalis TaxID=3572 RepID=A0AAW1JR06_SAPOF
MNKKGLAILMRTRMKPSIVADSTKISGNFINNDVSKMLVNSEGNKNSNEPRKHNSVGKFSALENHQRGFELVRESMHSAITMNKTEVLDTILNKFSEGYYDLSIEDRCKLVLVLAKDYDLNRIHVRDLIKQYLGLQLPADGVEDEGLLSTFYRTERNLRHALQPNYEVLFERLNTHPGGLKFLCVLRADILSILEEHNIPSLRALDSYLKEKLITWLSPAALELHQITWDDPASLLEKIVAYEAVHPISSLLDLKRRLGVGRRCFGYLHPAIPGEPLIFIEIALLKDVAQTIQEVLWDDPPMSEYDATCALFYSISSTQPGLAGINLGKFLIKRVIELVKKDMPQINTFATLSPIPGFMKWLLAKLASQSKLAEAANSDSTCSSEEPAASAFRENVLTVEEEKELLEAARDSMSGRNGMEVMLNLLTSPNHEWSESDQISVILKRILMRLCARYLLQEKKRGKALDPVANFHLQNGAMVERLNWMADKTEKGLSQSGGIMVNYIYRLNDIEENAHSYLSSGRINAALDLQRLVERT